MSKTKTSPASRTSEPSIEDILKLSKANNVKRIRLQFVDILGVPKNMSVHVDQLEKALLFGYEMLQLLKVVMSGRNSEVFA